MRKEAWFFALLAVSACGGTEPAAEGAGRKALSAEPVSLETAGPNHLPRIASVALNTRDAVAGVPLEASFEAEDLDGDPLSFSLTWLRNGKVEQQGELRSWTPGELAKGDRIELRVVASDGSGSSDPGVAGARVGNRAPEISNILIEPHLAPTRGQTLVATPIIADPDGDDVKLSFQWRRNGEAVRGADAARFELADSERGDRVRVEVRASDGEDSSAPVSSTELTLVNAPPVFEKFSGFEISGGAFRHQFHAVDPDGDKRLRFVLAEGPRGMEIDPLLGIATWQPGADAAGKIPVQVEVQDNYGAGSALRFELTVDRPNAPPPASQPAAE